MLQEFEFLKQQHLHKQASFSQLLQETISDLNTFPYTPKHLPSSNTIDSSHTCDLNPTTSPSPHSSALRISTFNESEITFPPPPPPPSTTSIISNVSLPFSTPSIIVTDTHQQISSNSDPFISITTPTSSNKTRSSHATTNISPQTNDTISTTSSEHAVIPPNHPLIQSDDNIIGRFINFLPTPPTTTAQLPTSSTRSTFEPQKEIKKKKSYLNTKRVNFRKISENILKELKQSRKNKAKSQHTSFPTDKTNEFIPHGDIMDETVLPNTTRIMLQNPNGLYGDGTDKFEDILTNFVKYKIDYLALPESKVNPSSDFTKRVNNIFNVRFPLGHISHTNTKTVKPSASAIQYGGVTSLISPTFFRKHSKTERDKYGRWLCHSFFLKETTLKIYNVYRVSYDGGDHEESATTQQSFALEEDGIHTSPRRHVVDALKKELEKDIEAGKEVIVMADANESRIHPTTHMRNMMKEMGFSNVMEEKLGKILPPTQNRSKEAIDHIWATKRIQRCVQACGILPRFDVIESDHRAICIDLDTRLLFSKEEPPLTHFDKRKLKSTDIKGCNEYLERLDTQFEHQKVDYRHDKFHSHDKKHMTREQQIQWLENSVEQLAEIQLSSENKQVPHNNAPWTPEISIHRNARYRLRNRIYKLKWLESRNIIIDAEELTKLQQQLEEVKNIIAEKEQTIEETKTEAKEMRAEAWVEQGKFKTAESAIKVLENMDIQSESAAILASAMGDNFKSGLNHVQIPQQHEYNDDTIDYKNTDTIWDRIELQQGKDIKNWESLTRREEMEEKLIEWSKLHFKQANTTPLASPEWIEKIDAATSINDLQQDIESLSPTTRTLLDELFPLTPEPQQQFTLTLDDFKAFIDSKDEKTTCSPSNIHYGHFKAARDHNITKYKFDLIKLAIDLNYTPTRWRRTITTLICKDDEPHIHRLRPLHIIEPEIQFISNKFWSKDFMKLAEDKGLLSDSQYGGRRGRQAQSAVLKQVLLWDITKLQNKVMASHMADARANFDRNMKHIVGRALISMGFDQTIVNFYQTFLKSQLFHIRTSFGVSDASYTYDENDPYFGDGQGIGWSSVNQIVISTVIDFAFNKLAKKFKVSSFDEVFEILTGVNFFIDDRFSNTINHENNIEQLMEDFQQHETYQTDLLNAAGGAIAPKKCDWWLLERTPNTTSFKFKIKPTGDRVLSLQNVSDAKPYRLKHLHPDKAKKYLGCLICPSYSPKEQVSKLHEIVDSWCSKIKHCQMSTSLILRAYREFLIPKLAYPLVVCDISKAQADVLMRKIRVTIATKTKYHRSSHLSVTHGPSTLFGEHLQHIYDIAGKEKAAFFQLHTRKALNGDDTVYDTLMTSFQDHQLWLGNICNFLNLDFDVWGKCLDTRTWLISLWDYFSHYDTKVDLLKFKQYTPPRENDFYLMDAILHREPNIDHIRIFNKVRVHFNLLTASDITLDDGKTIHKEILQQQQFTSRKSSYKWPNQEKLHPDWFCIFRSMLTDHISPLLTKKPLSTWNHKSHMQDEAILVDENTIIFQGDTYLHYKGARYHKSSTNSLIPDEPTRISILPTNELSIERLPHNLQNAKIDLVDTSPLPPNAWKANFWGIDEITEDTIHSLHEKLKQPFMVVFDAGLPDDCDYSIYAWGLADLQGKVFYKNGAAIGGVNGDHSSYGSEAYGAFSAISFINMMDSRFSDLSRTRKFYCDNEEVTKTRPSRYVNPKRCRATKRHYDIHTQLCHELACHKYPITIHHVRGHMDEKKDWDQLLPQEKVNCIVDGHCHEIEDRLTQHPDLHPPNITQFLPAQGISLRNPLHRLVKSSFNELCIDEKTANLMDYVCTKNNISPTTAHSINWSALKSFSNSLPHTHRRKYQKIIYNKWLTMAEEFKMEKTPNDLCPLCKTTRESTQHVTTCTHPSAATQRNLSISDFKQALLAKHTPLALVDLISEILQTSDIDDDSIDSFCSIYPHLSMQVREAIDDQTDIGLDLLSSGLIAQSWEEVIRKHYSTLTKNKLYPSGWSKTLVEQSLTYTHSLWKHRCEHISDPKEIEMPVFRQTMYTKYLDLRRDPSALGDYKSLINRSRHFFMHHSKEQLELWDHKVKRALTRTAKGLGAKRGLHQHFPRIPRKRTLKTGLPRRVRKKYSTLARRRLRNKIIRLSQITRYVTITPVIKPPMLDFLDSDDRSIVSFSELPKDSILRYHPP